MQPHMDPGQLLLQCVQQKQNQTNKAQTIVTSSIHSLVTQKLQFVKYVQYTKVKTEKNENYFLSSESSFFVQIAVYKNCSIELCAESTSAP